jgi:hypothetical protein
MSKGGENALLFALAVALVHPTRKDIFKYLWDNFDYVWDY